MTFSELMLILLDCSQGGRQLFRVLAEFRFASCLGLQVIVPKGFVTDFASVPRIFWRLFPPTGQHARASVVHDYLYTAEADCPRFLADAIFRHAMEISGVPWWKRTAMYYAVRMFGSRAYQREPIDRPQANGRA